MTVIMNGYVHSIKCCILLSIKILKIVITMLTINLSQAVSCLPNKQLRRSYVHINCHMGFPDTLLSLNWDICQLYYPQWSNFDVTFVEVPRGGSKIYLYRIVSVHVSQQCDEFYHFHSRITCSEYLCGIIWNNLDINI